MKHLMTIILSAALLLTPAWMAQAIDQSGSAIGVQIGSGEFTADAAAQETSPVSAPAGISARSYILMEMDSGRVLAGNDIEERLAMASTTKIMTALLTLEQPDLDAYFTIDPKSILVEGSSMGLLPGDQISLRGLATGMLLHSGNDSAGAAAVKIGGTVENFVAMMNERAAQMGLKNTHFATPSGLDAQDHYSSAYDMALLAKNALENEDFLAICSTVKTKISFGNPPYDRWLTNHNRLLQEYEGCIGVKTGFTKKAGRCLVSAARRDGVTLICVTLGAADDWNVHRSLLDYGFSLVTKIDAAEFMPDVRLTVVGGVVDTVRAVPAGDTHVTVLSEEQREITAKVYMDPFYYAPLLVDQRVGSVECYLGERLLGSWDLYPAQEVDALVLEKKGLWEKIKSWFGQ